MMQNPLDALHDVLPPEQVSWWPLTPASWAVILIALLIVSVGIWLAVRHWQHNRAKREAIKLSQQHTQDALALHGILKRLTRHYYGSEQAAKPTAQWHKMLNQLTRQQFSEQDLNSLYSSTPTVACSKLLAAIKTFKTKEAVHV
ncbi:DUF4381 domain-containing protein [Pseudoalteromonas rubra]|uniref:DUF4381 domain-containing protein n=1 Tax=Pseudoalteromonas rubra TaxID=43658 RepID=A0A5S3X517_9GAMM|nr:DUF4381 domain-containing protein [Pseudoalteromonas rubra]TMP39023.1 DUF4381 domain-containing protein [Pseudoalteromonas rubra]